MLSTVGVLLPVALTEGINAFVSWVYGLHQAPRRARGNPGGKGQSGNGNGRSAVGGTGEVRDPGR